MPPQKKPKTEGAQFSKDQVVNLMKEFLSQPKTSAISPPASASSSCASEASLSNGAAAPLPAFQVKAGTSSLVGKNGEITPQNMEYLKQNLFNCFRQFEGKQGDFVKLEKNRDGQTNVLWGQRRA